MKKGIWKNVIIYFFITALVVGVASLVTWNIGLTSVLNKNETFNLFELLLGEIANTLIVLSLTSVLSTNIGKVYWVDIQVTKLIKPFFQCFLAFTSYLIATLLCSISFYAFRFEDGVVACFIVSIILLVFLTYRMIGVYFGKNTIKEQLKWEYRWKYLNAIRGYYQQRNAVNYAHKEIHENEAEYSHKQITAIDLLYKHFNAITQNEYDYDSVLDEHAKFLEITSELKEKTLQALGNGEVSVVQENMELLSYAKDGETFREILNSIIVAKPDFAVDLLMKYKNKFDTINFFEFSSEAKNILHSLNIGVYPYTIYKKLMSVIKYNSDAKTKYEEFLKTMKRLESENRDKEIECSKISIKEGDEHYTEALRTEVKVSKQINSEYKELVNKCLGENEGIVLGKTYKPIEELYATYILKDLNSLNVYLKIMEEDRMEIVSELSDAISRGIENNSLKFKYLSLIQEEYVDLIVEQEKATGFLPKKTLAEISELVWIEFSLNAFSKTKTIMKYMGTESFSDISSIFQDGIGVSTKMKKNDSF